MKGLIGGKLMELRQLRYFVAVAEHGSFSRAARALNVAQSALSYQISELELELATLLLHRISRGVKMTEMGHVFYAHALSVLRRVNDAKLSIRVPSGEPSGRVSLGIPSSVCTALALPLLQSIKAKLPHITLVMSEESSGVLATQLLNGSVDLAVLFENPDCINIVSRPLVEEEMHYISRERFTESDDVPVSLETILGNPLMLDGEQQGVHRIVNDFARQYGVKLPRLVAELNSVNMLRAALVGGFANTILPPMSVWQELNNGALFGRAIGEPPLRRKIFICGSSAIPLTTAATSVLELIVELSHQLACSGTWVGATQFSV